MGRPPRSEEERRFLESYRPGDYPRPSVAVDVVILTVADGELVALLVQRSEHPDLGRWALPGGFVRVGEGADQGEDLDAAAARKLAEETGLPGGAAYLEQVGAFGKAGRDPRMRVISVAYCALLRPDLAPQVRAPAGWKRVAGEVPSLELAFDHREILEAALARVRERLDRSAVAFELVPPTFTVPELRAVHQAVLGRPQDPGNFRRRFQRMVEDGLIEPAPGKRATASRPAAVYRFKGAPRAEAHGSQRKGR